MRGTVTAGVVVLGCTVLCACGAAPRHAHARPGPAAQVVGCSEGGRDSEPLSARQLATSVVAGPLTLAYVKQYASQPPQSFEPTSVNLRTILGDPGSTTSERRLARRTLAHAQGGNYGVMEGLVLVAAGEQATVSVARDQRQAVSLVFSRHARNAERPGAEGVQRVSDGDAAVTFRACPSATTAFLGGYVVAGPRCVQLTVSRRGRPPAHLRLAFGLACPKPVAAETVLSRAPSVGVACRQPNSIACDRVGLAVWLRRPAVRVIARIDGRALRLHRLRGSTGWIGYRQPAGLLDGPLRVTPDRGRDSWQGTHPKNAHLVIEPTRADGKTEMTRLTVPLRAGWG